MFVGQLRNLLNLWNSVPDEFSGLYGPALLARKVKRLVIVAGFFPNSGVSHEYNFFTDIPGAQVLNNIDSLPISFMGIEQGNAIIIPSRGVQQMGSHPAAAAHTAVGLTNRSSWGGLGLLYAVRGASWRDNTYFNSTRGRIVIFPRGGNNFVESPNGSHEYLRKTQSDAVYIRILDDLLLQPRPLRPEAPPDRTGRALWLSDQPQAPRRRSEFVRLNQFGEVLVAGVEPIDCDSTPCRARFVLLKYGEAGHLHWRAESTGLPEPDRGSTHLRSVGINSRSLWLFGQYGPAGALFKFTDDGSQDWSYPFPGEATAGQMTVDSAGYSYLTHVKPGEIVVTKISPQGDHTGEAIYPIAKSIHLEAIVLDPRGNLYIAGGATDRSGHSEIFFLRSNRELGQLTLTAYPARYPGDARATAIAIDHSGNIYLTGYTPTAQSGSEFITLKFIPTFTAERLPGGPMRLRFHAPNQSLTLEATSDFSDWQPIATNRAGARGFVHFEDPDAAILPIRIYRATQSR